MTQHLPYLKWRLNQEIIEFWKSTVAFLARAENQPMPSQFKTTVGGAASGNVGGGIFLQ